MKKLHSPQFQGALEAFARDEISQPLTLRLARVGCHSQRTEARAGVVLRFLRKIGEWITISPPSARIQAATTLGAAALTRDQQLDLAPGCHAGSGGCAKPCGRWARPKDPEIGRAFAQAIVNSPVLVSVQESVFRTTFQELSAGRPLSRRSFPHCTRRKQGVERPAAAWSVGRESNGRAGRPEEGRKLFESGHGTLYRVPSGW